MAAISAVFTIGYVAEMLGEDEEWLWDLSIDMLPEDGCLRVYGVGEDGVPAFTQFGIECLQEIIRDLRVAGKAPPRSNRLRRATAARCGTHRMLTVHSLESATEAAQAGDNFAFAGTRPLDMSAYRRNGR